VDKPQADREFAALREIAKRMPQPSATLLRYVNDRDVVHLGPRLLPFIGFYGGDRALSASKSPKPSAPVFLLHGVDDNVIPPVESEYLAEDLRGHAPVRLLLSGLISHAEADRPVHVGDVMQLAGFWGELLSR
jgi:pimeloyl-ACP methyl ester carboxylesterase